MCRKGVIWVQSGVWMLLRLLTWGPRKKNEAQRRWIQARSELKQATSIMRMNKMKLGSSLTGKFLSSFLFPNAIRNSSLMLKCTISCLGAALPDEIQCDITFKTVYHFQNCNISHTSFGFRITKKLQVKTAIRTSHVVSSVPIT